MISAISVEIHAAIVGGLLSGLVVLVGVVLAEWLRRLGERRRRIFELLLGNRIVLDEFLVSFAAPVPGGVVAATIRTDRAAQAVQRHVVELRALVALRTTWRVRRRARRVEATSAFLLKMAAARVRASKGRMTTTDIQALMAAMVDIEQAFGAQTTADATAQIEHYIESGLTAPHVIDRSRTQRARPDHPTNTGFGPSPGDLP